MTLREYMEVAMSKNTIEDLRARREKYGQLGALDFLISYLESIEKGIDPISYKTLLAGLEFPFNSLPTAQKVARFKNRKPNGVNIEKDLLLQSSNLVEAGEDLVNEKVSSFFKNDLSTYSEANLLIANNNIRNGDEDGWLSAVNQYLKSQDISPLYLEKKDTPLFYRISSKARRYIDLGPKVTVIIPAFNAEHTIKHSVDSILQQSWQNLEVIVIDDCSTDNTWQVLQELAKSESRLIVRKNSKNSGPYIAKNLALTIATGDFITGHDADDWSHPERIEKQLAYIKQYNCPVTLSYMLRMHEDGYFSYLGKRTTFSPDGALRKALISTMFDRRFFEKYIGSWDCVRFGADSELFDRIQIALGRKKIPEAPFVSMLCLDLETNLTNHPTFGIDKKTGVKGPRVEYKNAWKSWHKVLKQNGVRLELGYGRKFFSVPPEAYADIRNVRLIDR